MSFYELRAVIQDTYDIDDDIADSMCFCFLTHVGQNRRRRWMKMNDDETIQTANKRRRDEEGNFHELTFCDLELT